MTSKPGKFLKFAEGDFLSQVLSEATRKDTLLDLFFVTREGLVGDVTVGGGLGHSDHIMVKFKFFGVRRKKVSRVATVDFKKANWKLRKELLSCVPWEFAFEGLGVEECWAVLKSHLLKAQQQAIPLCRKSSKRGRRPAWLNRELCL